MQSHYLICFIRKINDRCRFIAASKVTKVVEKIEESYEKHAYRFSKYNPFIPPNLKVNVLTYEELIAYAIEQHGQEKINEIQSSIIKIEKIKMIVRQRLI